MKKDTTQLNLDWPTDLLAEFKDFAEKEGQGLTEILTACVSDYMERVKKARAEGLPQVSDYKTNPHQRWLKKVPDQLNKYWICVLSGEPIQTVARQFKELHEGGLVEDYYSRDLTVSVVSKDVACCYFDLSKYAEDLKNPDVTWDLFVEEYERLVIQAVKELRESGHDNLIKIYKNAAEHRKVAIDNDIKSKKVLTTDIVVRELSVLMKGLRDFLVGLESELPPKLAGLSQKQMPGVIRKETTDMIEDMRLNPFNNDNRR